jgi:hypothetical protein
MGVHTSIRVATQPLPTAIAGRLFAEIVSPCSMAPGA